MEKTIPKIWDRKGIEKKHSHSSETGVREAFIHGNGREREFPLTPDLSPIIRIISKNI